VKSWTTELKVGSAILMALLILGYMIFSVGGIAFLNEKGYPLYVVFESAAGLEKKAPVRVSGVKVGQVEGVALVPEGARVALRIHPDVQLKAGGHAIVRSSGFLGDRFVEIVPGKGPALLTGGETLTAHERAPDVENLMNRFGDIANDIQVITAALRDILGDGKAKDSLDAILNNTQSLTGQLDVWVRDNRGALTRSVGNVESFTQTLDQRGKLLVDEGHLLVSRLSRIAEQVERGEGTFGKLLRSEEAYNKLNGTLDDLRRAINGVDTLVKRVESGEGTVGKLFTDDTVYNNFNVALEGLGNAVGQIKRFQTFVGFESEYQQRTGEQKGYFDIRIQPRTDKYYLVGLVNDPRGRITETTTVTTTNGAPITVTELETRRTMKLSAQFGRRVDNLGLRIGLFENSAGLGADYTFFDDRVKVSFDAWDFNSDDPQSKRAHLKLSAAYTLLRHIQLEAGYDQMLNRPLDTLFFGLGIRFEDEDLKYLLGGLSGLSL
jgi:phospholipid/cholesterol/gamma-HCH transport system substrate-binding protein